MREARMQFLIVNYKTPALTIRCVNSMTEIGISENDIFIVDNCSHDGSFDEISAALPNVKIFESNYNGGFAAGVNFGMKFASAPYVLILNPDTIFLSDFVNGLTGILEADDSIAAIGLNLLNPDHSPQYSARRFYSIVDVIVRRSPLKKIWPLKLLDDRHLMKRELAAGNVFDADWVLGTGFVVRKAVFEKLQGMDEGYFLYMEDVDLCARIWELRYRVVCAPGAAIIHDHQRDSAKSVLSKASMRHLTSFKRFYKKFHVPIFHVWNRDQVVRGANRAVPPPAAAGGRF